MTMRCSPLQDSHAFPLTATSPLLFPFTIPLLLLMTAELGLLLLLENNYDMTIILKK